VLSCESASAQWYLFPGRKNRKAVPERQEETPVPKENDDTTVISAYQEPEEDSSSQGGEYEYLVPDIFKVTLILPIQANGKPSSNYLEMYGGALMATREIGRNGRKIELNVMDESDEASPLTSAILEESHLVIGPVNLQDIREAIEILPENRFLVSPLEPKAASLSKSGRMIQAPAQWMRQADELAGWIVKDAGFTDEIVVFEDSVRQNIGEQAHYLLAKLKELGCHYRTETRISEFNPAAVGTSRVIIASERDSYINGMVRDLSVLVTQKHSDIVLYGTSGIRGSLGVDIEHLHNLHAHYTTGYFIDYDDPAVKSFILSYRALFKNEPGQFAFQGYDTMRYFLSALVEYGEQWYRKLPEYPGRGLQTDYYFEESESVGNINTAIRKVILCRDLSAIIVK